MLKKLFRYEFQAMGRILLPIYFVAIVMAIMQSLFTGILDGTDLLQDGIFVQVIYVVMTILFVIAIIAIFVAAVLLSVQRFCQNLLGKQGYLMHTLPVTTGQQITVKLVTAVAFQLLAGVVFFVILCLLLLSKGIAPFVDIWDGWRMLPVEYRQQIFRMILYVFVTILVALIYMNLSFYVAVGIGYSFHKHKKAIALGVFLVEHLVIRNIARLMVLRIVFRHINGLPEQFDLMGFAGLDAVFGLSHTLLNWSVLMMLIISAVTYEITHYFLKNKLNLE